MTQPYVDLNRIHTPAQGRAVPASWGDTVRENIQLFSRPPSVMARLRENQSFSANSFTALQFEYPDEWDTDAFHSPTSSNTRIVIPMSGIYIISWMLMLDGAAGGSFRQFRLCRNGDGGGYRMLDLLGPHPYTRRVSSYILSMQEGDFWELYFEPTDAATVMAGTSGGPTYYISSYVSVLWLRQGEE